jgi:hypothetical protein
MNRTPPTAVRRELRREVGFGCPIAGCGIPYLTWHHFDPEWRIEEHHRPEGLIALCLTHAGHADGGAYERDYLKSLKQAGRPEAEEVRGELTWMRRRVLALVGGNWYYETPVILQVGSTKAIAFDRDEEGYLLLSLRMPSLSGQPRARIEENFFTVGRNHVTDVECAARGRTIKISYPNGDLFRHEHRDISDEEELRDRYGALVGPQSVSAMVQFPVTVVEVSERTNNSRLEFTSRTTRLGGNQMTGCWSNRNNVGTYIEVSPAAEARLFADLHASVPRRSSRPPGGTPAPAAAAAGRTPPCAPA